MRTPAISAGRRAGRPAVGCCWPAAAAERRRASSSLRAGRAPSGCSDRVPDLVRCCSSRAAVADHVRRVGRLGLAGLQRLDLAAAGGWSDCPVARLEAAQRRTAAVRSSRCRSRSPNSSARRTSISRSSVSARLIASACTRSALTRASDSIRSARVRASVVTWWAVRLASSRIRLASSVASSTSRSACSVDISTSRTTAELASLPVVTTMRPGRRWTRRLGRACGGCWTAAAAWAAAAGGDALSDSICFLRFWFSSMSCSKPPRPRRRTRRPPGPRSPTCGPSGTACCAHRPATASSFTSICHRSWSVRA